MPRSSFVVHRSSFVLLLLSTVTSLALATVTFERRWLWDGGDQGHGVAQLADGGYLVSGETQFDSTHFGMFLARTDSLGDTTSIRQFSGFDQGGGYLCRLDDGGFALLGTRVSLHATVQKFTAAGDSAWTYVFPGQGQISSVIPTMDGGCMVVGRIPDTSYSFGLIKLNADGQQAWIRYYFEPRVFQTWARCAFQTPDSGYIVCGDGSDYGGVYIRLVRINSRGDTLWTRLYYGPARPALQAIHETQDHGFLAVGSELDTLTGNNALYVLRTDSLGNIVQTSHITLGGADTKAAALVQTRDGGYVIAGTADWGDSARVWLEKTDANGDTTWTRLLGEPGRTHGLDVKQTADGGYVIAGSSELPVLSTLLLKTDSAGSLVNGVTEDRTTGPRRPVLSLAPNPVGGIARIRYSLPAGGPVRLELYDVTGKLAATLTQGRQAAGSYALPFRRSNSSTSHSRLPRGAYLLRLATPDLSLTRKVILQ